MAKRRRRRKAHGHFVYGKDFAGKQRNKKSLVWSDSKETKRKDALL